MLKNFNWGWGIGIFYSCFVAFMLFMVWRSTQLKTELVTADYYSEELKYQQQLDKMKRANSLDQPLHWTVENRKVLLQFPQQTHNKDVRAQILFYRPDNSLRDFNMKCSADSSGRCIIASDKFRKGVYRMKVDWSCGSETYFNEGTIKIN